MSRLAETSGVNKVAANQKPLLPPEEKFWKRYSPRYELPLSSFMSVGLHVLALAVIIAAGWLAANWQTKSTPIVMDVLNIPGGGGLEDGQDDGTGASSTTAHQEAANENQTDPSTTIPKINADIKNPEVKPPDLPDVKPETAPGVYLESADQAFAKLSEKAQEAKEQLLKNLGNGVPSKGSGGGTGGGHGKGIGPGNGDGSGSAGTPPTERQARSIRWYIRLDRPELGGEYHLKQLDALGAYIALPDPNGGYRVFRDLKKRPPPGKKEDIPKVDRIFWMADRPERLVSEVGRVLRVNNPPYLVVFLPQPLEEHLAEMEKDFRGKAEKDIDLREKIIFQVVPSGGGFKVIVAPNQ